MELCGRAEVEALSSAVLAITEPTGVGDVLQRVVESARALVDADYAALGVPDDSGRFAEFHAAGVSEAQWRAIGPVPRTHGLLGVMMRENRVQRLPDIQADPRFSGWPSAHPDLHGFLGVPIVDYGRILGAVYVANKHGGAAFTDDDERLLSMLAAHAALALGRARLFERERELALAKERERIARDLHDAVAQKLFSLRLTLGAAEVLATADARVADALARAADLGRAALDELRAVVTELRPPALREDGLVAALRKHVEVLARAHPVTLRFAAEQAADGEDGLDPLVEDVVFRIGQEALHNALRHAAASTIDVVVRLDPDAARLVVRDDGRGLDVLPSGAGQHLGVASMRERARRAGGRLTLDSAPGGGTTVRLEVPRGRRVGDSRDDR